MNSPVGASIRPSLLSPQQAIVLLVRIPQEYNPLEVMAVNVPDGIVACPAQAPPQQTSVPLVRIPHDSVIVSNFSIDGGVACPDRLAPQP